MKTYHLHSGLRFGSTSTKWARRDQGCSGNRPDHETALYVKMTGDYYDSQGTCPQKIIPIACRHGKGVFIQGTSERQPSNWTKPLSAFVEQLNSQDILPKIYRAVGARRDASLMRGCLIINLSQCSTGRFSTRDSLSPSSMLADSYSSVPLGCVSGLSC